MEAAQFIAAAGVDLERMLERSCIGGERVVEETGEATGKDGRTGSTA
jgi:hypothetical protein